MRHSLRITLILALCAMQLAFAATAFAAPAAWESVDVVSHSEENGGVMTVFGTLPDATTLPAEAQLSVPAGAEIQWIGEILGGPPAEDPELKYTKTTANGADIYSFTLTKSRIAQIEMLTSDAQVFDGTAYASSLKWVAGTDLPQVRLAIRIPAGATITAPTPGATSMPGETGYDYYTKTVTDVKAGDALVLAAGYTLPPVAGASTTTGASSGNTVSIIIVVVLLLAGVGLVISVRRKMGAREEAAPAPAPAAAKKAATVATQDDDSGSDDFADDAPEPATASRPGAAKRTMVTGIIVAIMVIVAIVLGMQAAKPQVVGDTITETYSPQEACATISIGLSTAGDDDPASTGKTMFDAIRPLPGLTSATYNHKTGTLEVGFCESETSEAAIREALAPTGVLAASAPTTPTP